MKLELFTFKDYKTYLNALVNSAEMPRGYTKKLAMAAGCQPSYFSTVLHAHNHLTPDHAIGLCLFWNFDSAGTDYFLLLVDFARSATPALKNRIKSKLKILQQEHEDLSKRLNRPAFATSALNSGSIYYSSWLMSALHIMTSIPKFQKVKAIAAHLQLPEKYVNDCLVQLEVMGLVTNSNSRWEFASHSVHIPRESPFVSLHHSNWRQRAILYSQMYPLEGTHYTTVTSMSEEAFIKIKNLILKFVDEFAEVSGPSACEKLVCLNLDFFEN